jgi:hypothetical protein
LSSIPSIVSHGSAGVVVVKQKQQLTHRRQLDSKQSGPTFNGMGNDTVHKEKVILSVRIARKTRSRVKALAATRDITVEALVGDLIDQALERSMESLPQQAG